MSIIMETDFGLSILWNAPVNQTAVFSPISIALALASIHIGANGRTKGQLLDALCFGEYNDDICATYYSFVRKYVPDKDHPYFHNWRYCQKPGNISCVPEHRRALFPNPDAVPADYPLLKTGNLVKIVSRLFASNTLVIEDDFVEDINYKLKATVQMLNYGNATEAAKVVNRYIEEETLGKVAEVVNESDFRATESKASKLLLVNSVYFFGKWTNAFEADKVPQDFFKNEQITEKVTYLQSPKAHVSCYTDDKDFMAIGLWYQDPLVRYTIVLPKERFGLGKVLEYMNAVKLQQIVNSTRTCHANVVMPKFKLEAENELKPYLQKLGIIKIFNKDEADLSGITTSERLFVDEVRQKIVVEVDKKGTTAAALTTLSLPAPPSAPTTTPEPDVIDFIADHPFLFFISRGHHILFSGKYYGN